MVKGKNIPAVREAVEGSLQSKALSALVILVGVGIGFAEFALDGFARVDGHAADEIPFCDFRGIEENCFHFSFKLWQSRKKVAFLLLLPPYYPLG